MDDKITIIEGPTPAFEPVQDGWVLGLNEGPVLFDTALIRLRTFNGQALVERCHHAWRDQSNMLLEYRSDIGLPREATILAARNLESSDGQMLYLWVRRDPQEAHAEMDQGDDENSEDTNTL